MPTSAPAAASATLEEQETALRLLLRHCSPESLPARLRAARKMLADRELDPDGLLVLRQDATIVAAAAATVLPGRSGIVWPAQALDGPQQQSWEDELTQAQLQWLAASGACLAQALLHPDEAYLGAPLLRNGFRHVTALWYLRHDREFRVQLLKPPERLRFTTYEDSDPALFHATLERTFEQSLDCPEVTGLRSTEDVVAGFRGQGAFHPGGWQLAFRRGEPIGVLLLNGAASSETWEICYIGVVPEARRHGYGREIVLQALLEARAANVGEIFLTVDDRNQPARQLYRSLGFDIFDKREVFLNLLHGHARGRC